MQFRSSKGVRVSPWHAYETSSGPYPHHTDAESASIPLDQPPTPSKRSNKPQYGHHSLRSRRRLHLLITIALTAAVVVTFTSLKGQGLSNVPVGPWSHLAQLGLSGGLVGAGGVRPLPPNRLLLSTHNQVAWYLPDTDELLPLHEGEGVHYGVVPGEPYGGSPSLWVAVRPHNWRPATSQEHLLRLDATSGAVLERVQVASRFSHDMVKSGDRVYVCSTGDGAILELSYPDMSLVKRHMVFSPQDHPNTLAPLGPGQLWVVLHNLGESDVVALDMTSEPPRELLRIKGVGTKAHGLVEWGSKLIMLDSEAGTLVQLDPYTGNVDDIWAVPEGGKFLKGLAVIDDTAYFGINVWSQRSERDDPETAEELAAVDLIQRRLVWRRRVATKGLLNIVSAPHLGEESTYREVYSGNRQVPVELPEAPAVVAGHLAYLANTGYPSMVGFYWSSGHPALPLEPKVTRTPWESGLALPLTVLNVSSAQTFLRALPESMWTKEEQERSNVVMTGRADNMEKFKPGVQGIVLIFSDQSGDRVFRFPYYDLFAPVLEPLLMEVLGPHDVNNIIRLQLARMLPGQSDIRVHVDAGGYARHHHRIHIPLLTNPDVHFVVCPTHGAAKGAGDSAGDARSDAKVPVGHQGNESMVSPVAVVGPDGQPKGATLTGAEHMTAQAACFRIPSSEGLVFELNNILPHRVSNEGASERIHLVIDVAEEPRAQTVLPAGSTCHYTGSASGLTCVAPDGSELVPHRKRRAAKSKAVRAGSDGVTGDVTTGTHGHHKLAAPGASVGAAGSVSVDPPAGHAAMEGREELVSHVEGDVGQLVAELHAPLPDPPQDLNQEGDSALVSSVLILSLGDTHSDVLPYESAVSVDQVLVQGSGGRRLQQVAPPDLAPPPAPAISDPARDQLQRMIRYLSVDVNSDASPDSAWAAELEEGMVADAAAQVWRPHLPEENLPEQMSQARQELGWQLADVVYDSFSSSWGGEVAPLQEA